MALLRFPQKSPGGEAAPFEPWQAPDWSEGTAAGLEYVRRHTETQIERELEWYQRGIRRVRHASRFLRASAIAFTALGGLVPVLTSINLLAPVASAWGIPDNVNVDQVGYLFLGVGGAFALFDRFFGYSTAWMRYVTTLLALEHRRESFRLEWATISQRLSSSDPSVAARLLEACKKAWAGIKELTERETEEWVGEFKKNLSQFERDLRNQLDASRAGGIEVKVADGGEALDGFELALDQMVVERVTGSQGSVAGVSPGLHKVSVAANIQGKKYLASQVVNVSPGAIVSVELALGMQRSPSHAGPASSPTN